MLIWCYLDIKLQLMAHETYLRNGGSCGLMNFTFRWAFQDGLSIAVLPALASSNSLPLISTGGSVCKAVKATSLQTSQMVPALVLITAVTCFAVHNVIGLPSLIAEVTTYWIGQVIVVIFRMRKCWSQVSMMSSWQWGEGGLKEVIDFIIICLTIDLKATFVIK